MFIGLVVIPLSIALTFVLFLLVGNWFLDPMAGM